MDGDRHWAQNVHISDTSSHNVVYLVEKRMTYCASTTRNYNKEKKGANLGLQASYFPYKMKIKIKIQIKIIGP